MMKKFCFCSLKTGSLVLAVFNFATGIERISYWVYKLQYSTNSDDNLYYKIALCHAMTNVIMGTLLIIAIIKGNHNLLVVWLGISFCDLSVMMVFTGVQMFERKLYIPGFLVSIVLWYCWMCILNFYQELRIYNLGQKAAYSDSRAISLPDASAEYTEQVLCLKLP